VVKTVNGNNITAPIEKDKGLTASDSIVLLRCYAPNHLAKMFYKGGWTSYDQAKAFDATTVQVTDLDALATLLVKGVSEPRICAIRGKLISGEQQAKRIRRLGPGNGGDSVFEDVARQWLALDVDSLPIPGHINVFDIRACAAAVMHLLPQAFRGARCIVQATASHGFKPGARLRLWFWLDRPITCAEAKRWLETAKAPVDFSLFQPVGIHYTAGPLFADGRQDPLPNRVAVLDGRPVVAVPRLPDPPVRPPWSEPSFTSAGGFAARLKGIIRYVHDAQEGERNKHLLWASVRLGEAIMRGEISDAEATGYLTEAAGLVGLTEAETKATIRSGFKTAQTSSSAFAGFQFEARI
jgi:hypothetical protein